MSNQDWYIVGTGAVGSFCAANLHQIQHSYWQIARANAAPITFVEKEHVTSLNPPKTLDSVTAISNLIIPTKAYDVVPALEQVASKLVDGANVVLCHNGMGTLEKAIKAIPCKVNLYFCTTSNGAFKADKTVTLAGLGDTYWQAIQTPSAATELSNQAFVSLFRQSQHATDLPDLLWRKLIINCCINPLTALFRVKNGALSEQYYQPFIARVIEETVAVARAEGVELQLDEIKRLVANVIQSTAKNTSSMLQDVLANRPTEVDYINGFVVKCAARRGIEAPLNALLQKTVEQLGDSPLSQQTLDRLFQG